MQRLLAAALALAALPGPSPVSVFHGRVTAGETLFFTRFAFQGSHTEQESLEASD